MASSPAETSNIAGVLGKKDQPGVANNGYLSVSARSSQYYGTASLLAQLSAVSVRRLAYSVI